MKGDATCHTTNEQYRAGYDAIDWTVPVESDGVKTHRQGCHSGMCMNCNGEGPGAKVVVPSDPQVDRGRVRD